MHFYHNALSQRLQQLSAAEYNHPTTKPSTTTKHRNLAQKINLKLIEKQLENPIQNQDKPTEKPITKSTQTPLENPSQTQLKINPKQNQLKINPSSSSSSSSSLSSLFLVAFELSKKKKNRCRDGRDDLYV